MKLLLVSLVALSLAAGVGEPRPGAILAADGSVREVRGAAASFILGDAVLTGARQLAASAFLSVAKLDAAVRVNGDTEFPAPAGDALFGFSRDGRTAYAFFPADGTFARITESGCDPLPVDSALLGGGVVALAASDSLSLQVLVRRDDGLHAIRVRFSDGAIRSDVSLGIAASLALLLPDGTLLYAGDSRLIVRNAAGSERPLDLGAPVTSIALMGDGWVHVSAGGRAMAVRIGKESVTAFFLPEVAQ